MRIKLFLALPVYGAMDTFFAQSLIRLVNEAPDGIELKVRMNPGDSLVSRSRNTLTADFLASDCTHLLFIDSDLIFSPEQVVRICSHGEPVVGGLYPKKQQGPVAWVMNSLLQPVPARADGLQEVRYVGTGFLCVAREVFEQMAAAGLAPEFTPDHRTDRKERDYWSVGVYRYPDGFARYLSEDWFFCQRWLDLGGKVFADTRVVLKHVGQAIYPLLSQEGEIFREVTADNAEGADGKKGSDDFAGAALPPRGGGGVGRVATSPPPELLPADVLARTGQCGGGL